MKVLVAGTTGSIGKLVVEQALREGHKIRALVRSKAKIGDLPRGAEPLIAALTQPDSLPAAVDGVGS